VRTYAPVILMSAKPEPESASYEEKRIISLWVLFVACRISIERKILAMPLEIAPRIGKKEVTRFSFWYNMP